MNRPTFEQRLRIVEFYFENNGSVQNTYRALRPFYRRQNRPSEKLIRLTIERFRTTFTLIDNPHPQRRQRAQELDLYPSTLWKILRKDLGLRAYKIQTIIMQGVDSSNGPKKRLPLFPIFISEFCLAMKRTSG